MARCASTLIISGSLTLWQRQGGFSSTWCCIRSSLQSFVFWDVPLVLPVHRLCPTGKVTLQQDKALATPVLGSLCDPHGDLPTLRCPHAAQSCVPSPLCRGTSLRLGVPGAPWLGLGWGFTGRAGPDVPHSSPQAHSAQLFIPGFIPSPFFSFFSFSFTGIKSLKIAILPKPAGNVEPGYHSRIAEQQPSRLL